MRTNKNGVVIFIYKLLLVFIIFIYVFVLQAKAQIVSNIDPFGNTKLTYIPFHFAPFPFDSVIVLDNRKDTSCIAINENGDYPPEVLNFIEPATDAIGNYIKTSGKRKTIVLQRKVLINLKHLRVYNKNFIYRNEITLSGRLNNYLLNTLGRLEFSADIYLESRDNNFRKYISVKRVYTSEDLFNKASIKRVIDEMMDVITLYYIDSLSPKPKEPDRFKREIALRKEYVKQADQTEYKIADINFNTKKEYASYSILMDTLEGNGVYLTFEDLRDDIITEVPFSIVSNSKDSGYRLEADMYQLAFKKHFPYALLVSGKLFIRIYDDKYVELNKKGNKLCFDVPKLLHNMFAILSDERIDIELKKYGNDYLYGQGLIGASIAIAAESYNHMKFHITPKNTAEKEEFRHCSIDMFNGDIIY